MSINRRTFLKNTAYIGGVSSLSISHIFGKDSYSQDELYKGKLINLTPPEGRNYYLPLEILNISVSDSQPDYRIQLWDGQNIPYQSLNTAQISKLQVGGALGFQKVSLHDSTDQILDWVVFPVDCHTKIEDEDGEFEQIFNLLYEGLFGATYSRGKVVRYNHKYYTFYSSWFQDHVFVAEGMKYFLKEIKTGIDLYADGQREDGLIWDNYKHPYPEMHSFWEYRFNYDQFTYRPEDSQSSAIFVRIPVENMGEHTFIEGLYYAWKATGDHEWMKTKLDHALKAVDFATSSPYYWSEEHQLLKRPFTIDRWDFQSQYDTKITGIGTDFMGVNLDKTRMGIMFGDNICMANACHYLAEMLEVADRASEAQKIKQLGDNLWRRINQLSWNGNFYRHWVPLDPSHTLDFGVDESTQVTLSNAMALIRGIDHEKAVKIIQTYQRIKEEMPSTSPGEWYMCYPPFEHGWHIDKWEYMNGGVSPIVAGDLALGAFEHGFEEYGTSILRRIYQLGLRSDHRLRGAYKGKVTDPPQKNFTPIDISSYANTALVYNPGNNTHGWGSEKADLANLPTGMQEFDGIPFQIIDPGANQQKSIMVAGKSTEEKIMIPISQTTQSIYLLHTLDGGKVAGIFTIVYEDGTSNAHFLQDMQQIGHFWYPELEEKRKGIPDAIIAWKDSSYQVKEIGICAYGIDNPSPDKTISHLEFYNPFTSRWGILGITLSDGPHFFTPTIVSTIPAHWAAAHVFKALMEGLAGIKNTGVGFNETVLAPRWEASGVDKVTACAKYEPSGGYLSYEYEKKDDNTYHLTFSSNSQLTQVKLLVPTGSAVKHVLLNQQKEDHQIERIESSTYVMFEIEHPGVHELEIELV